ncbi:2928_t:CDS:10 [Ambispora leptoticha]|uniref:leucine--tRNA ligase n=1 Tax=Ambispora leptoticha TaxID=144679 RepID=A0A9N9A848_9GLOM|nr:2928_t:CDS:10 [Ambispora leptoticha]
MSQKLFIIIRKKFPYITASSKTRFYASLPKTPDFSLIEKKWIQKWKEQKINKNPNTNYNNSDSDGDRLKNPLLISHEKPNKFYVLSMFPYPSGFLHMGHVRVYTISDTIARFRKMLGYEVIHPMGWDAFGLPAENAAIERNIHPVEWTTKNIAVMKNQMEKMLTDFDWEREITTCKPDYYKWTQYLFLQLYKNGLAYQKEAIVNWDPVDKTVLANEQVDAEGKSWRSGAKVEHRKLKQWFFRITSYAEQLLADLELLDKWPDHVKQMQRNWIGKSEGAEFDFLVKSKNNSIPPLKVYTSRPDTIFGVHYLAVSLDHPLLSKEHIPKENHSIVFDFVENAKGQQVIERIGESKTKQGVHTGLYAIHPFTGESLPIYVSPYVLSDYGSGAVMGVPAHDKRDWEFTLVNKIVNENEIKRVVEPLSIEEDKTENQIYTAYGILTSESGAYKGLKTVDAMQAIVRDAQKAGFGRWVVQYRLRDWLLSRQRYWGTPIPIIHCEKCDAVPVPECELPVLLPSNVSITGRGESPLKQDKDWMRCKCPKYHATVPPHETPTPWTLLLTHLASRILPVDVYVGGVEHAILHLLYARFFSKFMLHRKMYDENDDTEKRQPGNGEPFKVLITQGMVQGKTYKDSINGRFLKPEELDFSNPGIPTQKSNGQLPIVSFEKMSKRKYNGVNPEAIIEKHGADSTRLFILFRAPVSEILEWDDSGIIGMQRWLNRMWRLVELVIEDSKNNTNSAMAQQRSLSVDKMDERDLTTYRIINLTVKEVTNALSETYTLNTVVSDLIKLTNHLSNSITTPHSPSNKNNKNDDEETNLDSDTSLSPVFVYGVETLVKILAPMAPSFAEECWEFLKKRHEHNDNNAQSIFEESWPKIDSTSFSVNKINCAIQINGKTRFVLEIPAATIKNQSAVEQLIRDSNEGKKWIEGKYANKKLSRVIHVVGGKLVNFVYEK